MPVSDCDEEKVELQIQQTKGSLWVTVLEIHTDMKGHYQHTAILEWIQLAEDRDWNLRVLKTTTAFTSFTKTELLNNMSPACVTDTEAWDLFFEKRAKEVFDQ